ncbi:MAG TPA: CoA pyrophosphatase [Bacteroidales bacterium]|nr:CoA pyrophosphatase [Bacteroidales bacterium]
MALLKGDHDSLAERLRTAIMRGLPGREIQFQLASSMRLLKEFPANPGPDAVKAAVLIMLCKHKESIYTVLMQRPNYPGIHGGQISFPGGKMELWDKNLIETAIREVYEETGFRLTDPDIIGILTPLFIPVSNIVVTAVVCWLDNLPGFSPDPKEVDHLIIADLRRLLDNSIIKTKPMEIRGEVIDIRYFSYDGYVIWGATAMILNELLQVIRSNNIPL